MKIRHTPNTGLRPSKPIAILVVFLLLAQACTGDDDDAQSAPANGGQTETPSVAGQPGPEQPSEAPQPDAPLLDLAVAGLGGEATLMDATSYRVTSSGTRSMAGEGFESTEGSHLISTFDVMVTQDLQGDRLRLDYDRTINYAADAKLSYREIIDGDVGAIDGIDTLFGRTGVMSPARMASTGKHVRLLNPHVLLREAVADPAIASDTGTGVLDGVEHRLLELDDPTYPLTLWVDPTSGQVAKLTTMENHHVFRDVTLEVTYDDWRAGDGELGYPARVTLAKDRQVIHEETRSAMTTDPVIADGFFDFEHNAALPFDPIVAAWGEASHQFQQEWSAFGFPLDFLETTVEARELAPGVWFIGGGTYTSMLVEQSDGLVIIESPLYAERSAAVLDWIDAEFPGQPVKAVVSTHHHVDHVGGLREFAAAGATVVANAESQSYFRRIIDAPSTIVPDTLAQTPIEVDFEWVPSGGSVLLDDPVNPVSAVHITTEHAADMVMIHVPSAQLVFNSDLHDPNSDSVVGPEAQPEGLLAPSEVQELLDAIVALDATVTTVVGGHGGGGPLAEVGLGPFEELDAFLAQFG